MKTLLAFIFIFTTSLLPAQTFHEYTVEGDKEYEAKNYEASGMAYDKAFALEEGSASQYYNAACSWALAGKSDKANQYLKMSATKGWRHTKHTKQDEDLTLLRETSEWPVALELIQANLDEYEKDFNKPLQKQLEDIHVRDQTLRALFSDVEEKWGRDSKEMSFIGDLMREQDSLCLIECIEIIEKHGWVGTSEVGNKANSALFLVIQHAPLETQEKYIPLLEASVKKGESRGSNLALMQDRILMRKDQPQIYGSQVVRDKDSKKYVAYDIKDPEYVNQRRAAIGMMPIEEYLKFWDIEWTVKQKEK